MLSISFRFFLYASASIALVGLFGAAFISDVARARRFVAHR